MSDYLHTRTLEPTSFKDGISSVRLEILNNKRKPISGDRLYFEIPLEVHLLSCDKIDFYQGTYRTGSERKVATEGTITHDDYISANITKKGKEILVIQSRDMRLLTLLIQMRRKHEKVGELERDAVSQ